MTWEFGRQTPDNNLMRFVARRFHDPAFMLDIGSGEGANARELLERGHKVWTLDKEAPAYIMTDIRNWYTGVSFDCIYDINTLCHVEGPPFEKIKSWLRPGGIFFRVCPTVDTWDGVGAERFTLYAFKSNVYEDLRCFSKVDVWPAEYPDFRNPCHQIKSWIVEARP